MKIKKKFLLVILLVFVSSLMFSASVKVKSPKGGESWQLGSAKLIKWEKSGNFTKFRIILCKDNKRVGDIALDLSPNSTSYLWKKVGEYKGGNVAAGSNYKIRVRGFLANGSVIDDSDSFLIFNQSASAKSEVNKPTSKAIIEDNKPASKVKQSLLIEIEGIKREIEKANAKLNKAKEGENLASITVTKSVKNIKDRYNSLLQKISDAQKNQRSSGKLQKLSDGASKGIVIINSLEQKVGRNMKSASQGLLNDLTKLLIKLESEYNGLQKPKTVRESVKVS